MTPDGHTIGTTRSHEDQRLAAVQALHLLDTPAEPAFDALTRLAAQALGTPMASIALLDSDRLWVKSRVGTAMPTLERCTGFSAHAITQAIEHPDQFMVVGDLSTDPRFSEHPLVAHAPCLRFYASAPLFDEVGLLLGHLSVLDTQPHETPPGQLAALADLRTLVEALLESHRRAIRLQTMALCDTLTGLSNRVHFERALEAEFGHAMRMDHPFTLLLLDLDGFKAINDGFGHAAGDEVLCEVSQRITQQMRQGDVLARLGGDEFGIVMRDGRDDAAKALAKRIVKAVSQPLRLNSGDEVGVGVSIGLAAYGPRIASVRTLMAHADQALYQAKQQNARRWKMFVGLRG
jgi:diguanylate cyclase (GGDEF)-like protein